MRRGRENDCPDVPAFHHDVAEPHHLAQVVHHERADLRDGRDVADAFPDRLGTELEPRVFTVDREQHDLVLDEEFELHPVHQLDDELGLADVHAFADALPRHAAVQRARIHVGELRDRWPPVSRRWIFRTRTARQSLRQ